MKPIEVARQVVETNTCHQFRPRKSSPGEYDARPGTRGNKGGWCYLDLFSASAIVKVHDALSESNRAKYAALHPAAMAEIAFKLLK